MKIITALTAATLGAMLLSGCETSGPRYGAINEGPVRGGPINEGPVRGGGVVVVDRQPDYRGDGRRDDYRRDGYRDGRGEYRDGRYGDGRRSDYGDDYRDGRYGDRDPCRGIPGYDPRYDRCDR